MNGYADYKGIGIRYRSSKVDVPLGTAPYARFVAFDTVDEAKQFIDGGRVPGNRQQYDMQTQEVVN